MAMTFYFQVLIYIYLVFKKLKNKHSEKHLFIRDLEFNHKIPNTRKLQERLRQ